MRNATRRNRNIGTVKQGHGQNNRMRIAEPYFSVGDWRSHTERLTHYKKFVRAVQGHEFTFVVEKTRAGCCHACSIEDVVFMLEQIPAADYGDLRLIVFRQPKHKEGILSPVWGWLCYEYQFENTCAPAVILEAFNLAEYLTHSRKLSIDARDEFDRLQQDGHVFIADRRGYRAKLTRETVRATQLYRTLPHEFGHYVHYRQALENSEIPKDERPTYYNDSIPDAEKEKFAHAYADRLRDALHAKGIIPFDPRK